MPTIQEILTLMFIAYSTVMLYYYMEPKPEKDQLVCMIDGKINSKNNVILSCYKVK